MSFKLKKKLLRFILNKYFILILIIIILSLVLYFIIKNRKCSKQCPICPPPINRKYKLTLWHEGYGGVKNLTDFISYTDKMTRFCNIRNIDNVFLLVLDPTSTGLTYLSVDNLCTYFFKKLNSNISTGILFYINTQYPWTYAPNIPIGYNTTCTETINNNIDTFINVKNNDVEPQNSNNMQQAFTYLNDLNNALINLNISPVSRVVFDSEDMHQYPKDETFICNALNFMKSINTNGALNTIINNRAIGWAGDQKTSTSASNSSIAFSELYWMGEIYPPPPAVPVVNPYQKFLNDPVGLYNYFRTTYAYGDSSQGLIYSQNLIDLWTTPGNIPLFSLEDKGAINCVSCINTNVCNCGTFAGFGNWTYDAFISYLDYFYEMSVNSTTGAKVTEIGIYEWQFMPQQWLV